MTTAEIIHLGKAITNILKKRFPHLTVEETGDIVGDIITVVDEELS